MGLNISKADLEKLVGSKPMGRFDDNGHFVYLDNLKLIEFSLAKPQSVIMDYERHIKEDYRQDAVLSDANDGIKSRAEALDNYLKYGKRLSELISSQSNSPVRTHSSIFTPVA